MRRSEREIVCEFEIRAILAREHIVRLAFAVGWEPYLVPLSYGYDSEAHALYFHTARSGRKLDFIEKNPRVCFEIEAPSTLRRGRDACAWGIDYESLIGYGVISEVTEGNAREAALQCLMGQHARAEKHWTFEERPLKSVRLWKLSIEAVTGKRAGPPVGARP